MSNYLKEKYAGLMESIKSYIAKKKREFEYRENAQYRQSGSTRGPFPAKVPEVDEIFEQMRRENKLMKKSNEGKKCSTSRDLTDKL